VNFAEVRAAIVMGLRTLGSAVAGWRSNPLRMPVNTRLWGRRPWLMLGALTAAAVVVSWLLASPVIRLSLPINPNAFFFPDTVLALVWSAPAFFAWLVAWRVRGLRNGSSDVWPERRTTPEFGIRFFEAAALPVVVAAVVLALGIEIAAIVDITVVSGTTSETEPRTVAGIARALSRMLVVVALVAGIGSTQRVFTSAISKLLGAGFTVWAMHLGIGFAAPFMIGWISYLPVIGQVVPERSVIWVHTLFDFGIALTAWTVVRERVGAVPLWQEETSVPPPPPPPAQTEA
jgi:hypothetical protein